MRYMQFAHESRHLHSFLLPLRRSRGHQLISFPRLRFNCKSFTAGVAMGDVTAQPAKRRKTVIDIPAAKFPEANAESYATQLKAKKERVEKLFEGLGAPDLELHESQVEHYRLRAEFRVWLNGDDIFYVMFDKRTAGARKDGTKVNGKQRVDQFPVASLYINELMTTTINVVKKEPILKHKLFQANFQDTLCGEAMVTLVYHTQLDDSWSQAARKLQEELKKIRPSSPLDVIGRAKNQKIAVDRDFVLERIPVGGRELVYKQFEGAFSQPNGGMCRQMLGWAQDVTRGDSSGDLLELYCGNGNFSIALAGNFREVIATEVSKASVAAATYNIEANKVSNVHVARLSSEEFVQAWRGDRDFFRMKGMPEVKGRKFQTLLVDPPRAGLDDKTVGLLQYFDNVVYISCNPVTLHQNILKMGGSHGIKRIALFDQFPYTDHIECGVYLVRK